MPFCGFAEGFGMFDVTPVENLFIEEYMMRAPGDYVKVYLYGLRMCYHPNTRQSLDGFARALGMEEDTVRDAFAYWERQGVVRRLSDNPPSYAYQNLKAMLMNRGAPEEAQLYQYRDFNNALQALFGTRLLHPADYTRAAEWIEELRMSEEAVLLLVRHAIATKGAKVSFSYMDKMAVTWAKEGRLTKEAAQEYLLTQSQNYDGARRLLTAMGLRRAPSVAEEQLYGKWRDQWMLSPEDILAGLGEMTKISNPNFAYLDKVLESGRGKAQYPEAVWQGTRELMRILGQPGVPTVDFLALYTQWLEQGFDKEAIAIAGRMVKRSGGRTMAHLEESLDKYRQKNLFTAQDIGDYLSALKAEREAVQAMKIHGADETKIDGQDIGAYRSMEKLGLPAELLMQAAEYARGSAKPMLTALKIARDWQSGSVRTPQAAQAEHQAHENAKTGGGAPHGDVKAPLKRVSAQQFTQREYTDADMDVLLLDMDSLSEGAEG